MRIGTLLRRYLFMRPVMAGTVVPVATEDAASRAEAIRLHAVPALRAGRVLAVPTDTIYGVCALSQSDAAVSMLYDIKGRDAGKPVAICVHALKDVGRYGQLTITPELLSQLLPGPVTVVLERTPLLNPNLNPGTQLVGIRIPDHPFMRELVQALEEPLALTSANASGEPSTVAVEEFKYLWDRLACVFDGGRLQSTPEQRLGSTVVDLSVAGSYRIIRPGSAHDATVAILQQHGLRPTENTQSLS